MEYVIAWSGFLGAWLLVAGPIQQAAVELEAEGLERGTVESIARSVPRPPKVSSWWWLLPPVAFLLNRRQTNRYQDAVFAVLDASTREQFVRFSNVATGWMFVALGAFFIAVKETWEVVELYEWTVGAFVVLVVVMVAIATVNTVLRIRRSHQMVAGDDQSPAGAAGEAATAGRDAQRSKR